MKTKKKKNFAFQLTLFNNLLSRKDLNQGMARESRKGEGKKKKEGEEEEETDKSIIV